MSFENRDLIYDLENTSHVPDDEGEERGRLISHAADKAAKSGNNENDFESKHSPTVGGSYSNNYSHFIPDLPKQITLAYRRDVSSFYALQEWEGYVTKIKEDTFEAELVDLTSIDKPYQERAIIEKKELSLDSLELLKDGAVFRWSIGYEILSGGTKQRVSRIVFRRIPAWSKIDLEEAKEVAKSIISEVKWE